MAESQKGIRIPWSEASLSVPELFDLLRDELPVLVKVTEGYHGQTDADTFRSGENFRISAAWEQRRVLCHDPQHQRHLSIPVDSFAARVQLSVPGRGSSTFESFTLKEILDKYKLPVVVTVLPLAPNQRMTVGTSNLTSGLVKLKLLECYDEPFLLSHSFVPEVSLVDRRLTPILLSAPLKLQFCRVSDNSSVATFDKVLQVSLQGMDFSHHGKPTNIVTFPGDKRPRWMKYGPDVSQRISGYAEGGIFLPQAADRDYIPMNCASPPRLLPKPKTIVGATRKKPMTLPEFSNLKKSSHDENTNEDSSGESDSHGYEEIDPQSEPESPDLPPPRIPERNPRQVGDNSTPLPQSSKPLPPTPPTEATTNRNFMKHHKRISDTYRVDLPGQNRDSSMYDYTLPDPETEGEDGYTGLQRTGSTFSESKPQRSSKIKPLVAAKPAGMKRSVTDKTTQQQKASTCELKPLMADKTQNAIGSEKPVKGTMTGAPVLVASSGKVVSEIPTIAVTPILLPPKTFRALSDVPRDLRGVSVCGVLECLRFLHMGQYCDAFKKQHIDGDFLMEMETLKGEGMFVKQFNLATFDAQLLIRFVCGWRPKLNEC